MKSLIPNTANAFPLVVRVIVIPDVALSSNMTGVFCKSPWNVTTHGPVPVTDTSLAPMVPRLVSAVCTVAADAFHAIEADVSLRNLSVNVPDVNVDVIV